MSQATYSQIEADPSAISSRRAVLLDTGERLFVLALYGWLVGRMLPNVVDRGSMIGDVLLLLGEGLVVVFFLIRHRTTQISQSPKEWFIALGATCAPLLVIPGGAAPLMPTTAVVVMILGLFIQLSAKLTLARSFGMVPANRGLKTSGPYRFVRHPMYCGYLLMQFGFLALNPTWWNLTAYAFCDIFQLVRILAEEQFLSRDPNYREYTSRVSYRILPGVF